MPSAEDTSYLLEVMPADPPSSGYSHDVDVLVSRIKENLRLSKSHHHHRHHTQPHNRHHRPRPAPYKLPMPTSARDGGCGLPACGYCTHDPSSGQTSGKKSSSVYPRLLRSYNRHYYDDDGDDVIDGKGYTTEDLENSYERFQALLRNGALIKEAVKRLRSEHGGITDEDDEDDDASSCSTMGDNVDYFKNRYSSNKMFCPDEDENLPIEL